LIKINKCGGINERTAGVTQTGLARWHEVLYAKEREREREREKERR